MKQRKTFIVCFSQVFNFRKWRVWSRCIFGYNAEKKIKNARKLNHASGEPVLAY